MKTRFLSTLVVMLLLFPGLLLAFHGTVDPIPATLVTDKLQTGEPSDHDYQITEVSSEGYIEGSTGTKKVKLLFKDLVKIEGVGQVYKVEAKDGKKYDLKFAAIRTHYTSTSVDCLVKNPDSGKVEEKSFDPTKIKSITFIAKGGVSKLPVDPATAALDRKDPKAVAEAVLKALREGNGEAFMAVCNATNKRKISAKELPQALKELKEQVGDVEKIGDLKAGPKFMARGTVCAYLRTEGKEAFVIVLTCENGEYGFEDINSPDVTSWNKTPTLK